jgi:transcriptional regulator with XRE-family HTH domain
MKTITLGQRIRELREEKDMSLRDLAKEIKVSAPFLSDVELGRRYPSDKILSSIAHALGTLLDDLRTYDTRIPVDELKRLATSDPRFGFAFRKVIDKNISSQDLIDFADSRINKRRKS